MYQTSRFMQVGIAACAAGMFMGSALLAGTEEGSKTIPVEEIKKSFISGDLGVTMISEWIARGVVVENQGVMAQPYLDLYVRVYEGTGFINSVSVQLGLWSSIDSHVVPDGSTDRTRNWREFDYMPGITVKFAKHFSLALTYFEYDSPADVFDTARSINARLDYNDTDLLGAFALHPHVTVLRELTAPGFAGLAGQGWYYEVGIAPTHSVFTTTKYPVAFALPITAGFGSHHFYDGGGFGFLSSGVTASVPLSFIPPGYGGWTFTTGYAFDYLGSVAAEKTALGKREHHIFTGAIGLVF